MRKWIGSHQNMCEWVNYKRNSIFHHSYLCVTLDFFFPVTHLHWCDTFPLELFIEPPCSTQPFERELHIQPSICGACPCIYHTLEWAPSPTRIIGISSYWPGVCMQAASEKEQHGMHLFTREFPCMHRKIYNEHIHCISTNLHRTIKNAFMYKHKHGYLIYLHPLDKSIS